ncbi:MAG: Insecticidal toxin complex protein [Pseudomonas sp.]|uniref:RHS repeat-associated core domain-containing protein n=1 Tax=Pseudomonas sp. TaxID=306 RepID=UPI002614428F|nr:RHS repeat-associated core domain-containing protein [Pseudomonas sp.]MDB6048654.1 Insecticidal toxin complex protein [Pseudomonas sp.]
MYMDVHAKTPVLTVSDPRQLLLRLVTYYRASAGEAARPLVTHTTYDAAGRPAARRDPRLFAWTQEDATTPANLQMAYSLSGKTLLCSSVDAGDQVTLISEGDQAIVSWEGANSVQHRVEYDAQLRPLFRYEQVGGGVERCVECFEYAENKPSDALHNCCGRLVLNRDPAGSVCWLDYGLHGNALNETRQFLALTEPPHWPDAELEPQLFTTSWLYDAFGTVLQHADAQGHRRAFSFGVDGQMQETTLSLASDTTPQRVVHSRTYDASGQPLSETAGNGVVSTHAYDSADGRLQRSTVKRSTETTLMQDLHYQYDPVGNITQIEDTCQPSRYFRNQRSDGINTFLHDSLYQLIEATGRETVPSQQWPAQSTMLPLPGLDEVLAPYRQLYTYDDAGNLVELCHQGQVPTTRTMTIEPHSNRALPWNIGDPPPDWASAFDAHGNQLRLSPGGPELTWNARHQLQTVTQVARAGGNDDHETYVYGSDEQRVRKVTIRQSKSLTYTCEVRYLPGLELHSDTQGAEWAVISVAGVRVMHWSSGRPPDTPNDQTYYSVVDHLESYALELDAHAALVSAEGYYPFGGSAWWAGRNETEANYKTRRYSGKERDATGLYYYGLRYYAPWLLRWLSPDPAGDIDGMNLYCMVRNNPVTAKDVMGAISDLTMKYMFDDVASGGVLAPMTGGAVFGPGWERLEKSTAEKTLALYKESRADGAARVWSKQLPSQLTLSDQARHNWKYAEPGNAFSGMIDARTAEIYLVPATSRSKIGVDGQTDWSSKALKKQWFSKTSHYEKGNIKPYRNGKLANLDHGRAAYYLEGKEKALPPDLNAFDHWFDQQKVSSNWLGFFVHADQNTGRMVLNYKSAQLNSPNLLLAANDIDISENTETKRLDISLKNSADSKTQQQEQVTQLPDSLKTMVSIAMSAVSELKPHRRPSLLLSTIGIRWPR